MTKIFENIPTITRMLKSAKVDDESIEEIIQGIFTSINAAYVAGEQNIRSSLSNDERNSWTNDLIMNHFGSQGNT